MVSVDVKHYVYRFTTSVQLPGSLTRFPGSLRVLTSTYKLNLPSTALQVLIILFASQSLQVEQILKMHTGSYKNLIFPSRANEPVWSSGKALGW